MHPLEIFCCQNPSCPDAGIRGQGNLRWHGYSGHNKLIRCIFCRTCKKYFSERKGTVLEHSRLPEGKAISILEHMREGCGVRSTARLTRTSSNTVRFQDDLKNTFGRCEFPISVSHDALLVGTSLISKRHPTASAYRCRVEMDGECFAFPPPDSNRATDGGLLPICSATWACVIPAFRRAAKSSSNKRNLSSKASYAALNSGSAIHSATISSWVVITHLFQSVSGDFQIQRRGFVRFLDDGMQNQNLTTNHCTEKCAANAAHPFRLRPKRPRQNSTS